MADRVEELLVNPRLRRQLSARGLEAADRYAFGRVAPRFRDALNVLH
jgi:hypothetical protein